LAFLWEIQQAGQNCLIFGKRMAMGEKAQYRSAMRSRENIRKAYVELIHEKGTINITVKELVERADVNRSTFYAHYQDIYAVLEEIENEIVQKMFTFLDASEHTELLYNPLPFLMRIGAELERNREFYRLLIETSGSVAFIQKLKGVFLKQMLTDKKAFSQVKRQREFLVCMNLLAGGGVDLLCDWVTGKIDVPMKELASIVNEIAMNAMRQFI
jgi:AcrR family transcriptional regulator